MNLASAVTMMALVACQADEAPDPPERRANAAPGAPVVEILPTAPTSSDNLLLDVVVQSEDPDGDKVYYAFAWDLDGMAQGDLEGAAFVPADRTRLGDTWGVTVTPYDGMAEGPPARSSAVVGNSPPVVSSLSFEPEDPRTDDPIRAHVVAEDADGDPVSVRLEWRVDDVVVDATGTELAGERWFDKGQEILITAIPHDGLVDGEPRTLAVVVANTPPSTPHVALDPTWTLGEPLVCGVLVEPEDADGDPVSLSFSWASAEGGVAGLATTRAPNDTILADDLPASTRWTCHATPWDGEDEGDPGQATLVRTPSPLTLVRVPAGTFQMGSPEHEPCRESFETQHPVTLTRDFWIGTTEVTQGQFEDLMGFNPAESVECGSDCPVEHVSWGDAAAFANALSEAYGLEPCYACGEGPGHPEWLDGEATDTGLLGCAYACEPPEDPYACEGFRLPTEAEWEYAARASSRGPFLGDRYFPTMGSADACESCADLQLDDGSWLSDLVWFCHDWSKGGQPVASKSANDWGLHDMHGSVAEYCNDGWDLEPWGPEAVVDPVGVVDTEPKLIRGGAGSNAPGQIRLASRNQDPMDACAVVRLGFRVARTATRPPSQRDPLD